MAESVSSGKNGKTRTKTRDEYKVIQKRIFDHLDANGITQEQFAAAVGVSSSTVNRWINKPNCIPPVYKLKKVADELGITVESLITGEDHFVDRSLCSTYSRAFLSILELSGKGVIQPKTEDPFLNWLLDKKLNIVNMARVDDEKKAAWMKKVLADYDAPLLPVFLTQYIELFLYAYAEIEEYDTYLVVFRLFQGYGDGSTKEEVDHLIKSWTDSEENGTLEFPPGLKIPWNDRNMLVAIDKDGNTYMKDKPRLRQEEDEPRIVEPEDLFFS